MLEEKKIKSKVAFNSKPPLYRMVDSHNGKVKLSAAQIELMKSLNKIRDLSLTSK